MKFRKYRTSATVSRLAWVDLLEKAESNREPWNFAAAHVHFYDTKGFFYTDRELTSLLTYETTRE